jgi:hypothetical protein
VAVVGLTCDSEFLAQVTNMGSSFPHGRRGRADFRRGHHEGATAAPASRSSSGKAGDYELSDKGAVEFPDKEDVTGRKP